MNVGLENNLKIAEKYCINPNGCPKLKGKTDYNEKLTTCAGCTNYLNKIDLVELLNHLYNNNNTSPTPKQATRKGTGKSTELSTTQIRKILELQAEGLSIHKIAKELKLQDRTVKNVVILGFKNEKANEKVKEVMKNMGD